MKLLITGGCGFLGSNLAAHALEKGDDLCVFDNLSRYGSSQNLNWLRASGEFQFIHGDIRNANDVEGLVRRIRPDVIFHLAGQVAMTTSIANPRFDFEINAGGTLNLLEAVREHSASSVVLYSSTNKVYGDLEQLTYEEGDTRYRCLEYPEGFGEGIPLDFHSPYGCSKGAADQYMLDYARMFNLNTVVFRHSSMYGGRQFATFDQGWIGWFCQQALKAKKDPDVVPFTISGTGKQVRDVLHADDVRALYFAAVDHIEQARGQAFNIGGGYANSLSLLELFALLEEILELDGRLIYTKLARRDSDQNVFVADVAKAKQFLGWFPSVEVKAGLESTLGQLEV